MIDHGYSVLELRWNVGLLISLSLDEESQLFEETEGDAMRVD